MRLRHPETTKWRFAGDNGVSSLIEYITISGILMVVLVITMLVVPNVMIVQPSETLSYYSFADIANGVSTRIVDVYAIPEDSYAATALSNGQYGYFLDNVSIVSKYDIPDTVAGKSYAVDIEGFNLSQNVVVSGAGTSSTVYLAGIGATRRAGGSTTGAGVNQISYNYP